MTPLLLLSLLAGAVQAAPVPSQGAWSPTSKWVARFDEDKCAAIREYGRGAERVQVDLRPDPMGTQWTLNIEAPGAPGKVSAGPGARVRIGGKPSPDVNVRVAQSARTGYVVYTLPLGGSPLEKLGAATTVTLEDAHASYHIPLSDLQPLTATLKTCIVDLLASWGFSREEQARLASPPRPVKPVVEYVSHNDYPEEAIRQMASGTTFVRLTITSDGRQRECAVVKSSGNRHLDWATCKTLRRATFDPGRNLAGRPVDAPYFTALTWMISG